MSRKQAIFHLLPSFARRGYNVAQRNCFKFWVWFWSVSPDEEAASPSAEPDFKLLDSPNLARVHSLWYSPDDALWSPGESGRTTHTFELLLRYFVLLLLIPTSFQGKIKRKTHFPQLLKRSEFYYLNL